MKGRYNMISTNSIQPVLALTFHMPSSETMIFFLPIILACIVIFFTRFPKTGIVLSAFLCFGFYPVLGMMGRANSSSGFLIASITAEFGAAGMVGIVACVIQRRINKLSARLPKKASPPDKK